jgi:HTH-type transcriptional regulator/antitoxin HigA
MSAITPEIQCHWAAISPFLCIRNEQEYDLAVERLNNLIDEVGTDEQHPLYTLLETLGTLVSAYEKGHHSIPRCGGAEVLRFLMEEQGLTPSDLRDAGSEDVVLDILCGKRELDMAQIRALAERFHVSPAVFL